MAEQLGHGAEQTLRTYGHVIAEYRDREAIDADAEILAARNLPCPPGVHGDGSEQTGSAA